MKSNILITGFDKSLNETIAQKLADNLGLYYLSISELTLYYANRQSKEIVILEGGQELYNKFVRLALKDAKDFENTIASLDMADVNALQVNALLDTSLVIFLAKPYKMLSKYGINIAKEDVDNSRAKYRKCYDIFINAGAFSIDNLQEKIIKEITSYFGG